MNENQVKVVVHTVKHWPKCARCYKHDPSADTDPVFPNTCPRCSSVMHTMFYDLHHGYYHLLPPNLTRDVDEFIQTYVREPLRNMDWVQIQEKFKREE